MISARALGILFYLCATGESATVVHLNTVFREGREALRTAFKELEEAGFVERKNTKIQDRHVRESRVTDAGFQYLSDAGFWAHSTELTRVSGRLLQLSVLNNNIHLNSQVSKEYTRETRDEYMTINVGEEVPYEFFESTSTESDWKDERKKYIEYKKKAYEEVKRERNNAKKIRRREDVEPMLWTSSDIGYEFADRLQEKWNIKPWSLTQTRFVPALAEMRKRLDTDGQVELLMLDMFFSSVDFQKYDDPHMLWKMFIKRAPELAPQAIRMVRTPEQLEEAQVAADKSWDWMEE